MSFPADIKGCMKDCILSLFWPRKDIVGFFEKHGCTKAELSGLQIEGEGEPPRGGSRCFWRRPLRESYADGLTRAPSASRCKPE